ncbi:hypothetical protein [Xanthomonas campestris]|uniref:hypothetical protein n=1 Tax=Xanthomonas campestris TaxID=339 RepID=UPI00388DB1AE
MSSEIKCTCPSGDGSLRWPCPAHQPSLRTSAGAATAVQPVLASDLVFGHPRELFRVTPAGDVVVSEGVSTTDAARAFWEAVAQMRPRPDAAALNELSGNSEQLAPPDAGSGGDALVLPPPGIHAAVHYAAFLRREAYRRAEPTKAGAIANAALMIDVLVQEVRRLHQEMLDALSMQSDTESEVNVVRDALAWYGEQAEGCRKVGSLGASAQKALDADGGKRAKAALSARQPVGENPAWRDELVRKAVRKAYIRGVEFDRARETPRRQSAVELLLSLGYVWTTDRWEARQPAGGGADCRGITRDV